MMERIKTYIVNLPQSVERRNYMESLMAPYRFLDVSFFDAVYGRMITDQELVKVFDESLAYRRYGRKLQRGEIGCSLSHFGIYRALLASDDKFCLVLEDDITILKDIQAIPELVECLNTSVPTVLFLSGDYWWTHKRSVVPGYEVANVYDAVGTYAYLINRAAAALILKKNPRCASVADNWALFRQQGVSLKAVFPYLIDANIEDFQSEINQTHFGHIRENMPIGIRLNSYWVAAVKKLLVKSGRFVSKIRTPKCHQSQS